MISIEKDFTDKGIAAGSDPMHRTPHSSTFPKLLKKILVLKRTI
jgi:hypothetical protein